jgi:hypothetical protein
MSSNAPGAWAGFPRGPSRHSRGDHGGGMRPAPSPPALVPALVPAAVRSTMALVVRYKRPRLVCTECGT